MSRILKKIFIGIIGISLITFTLIMVILWNFSNNIPDYKFLKNYKPPVSSKVYSGNGELVSDFSKEKRIFVPYSSIPEKVINAFNNQPLWESYVYKLDSGEDIDAPDIDVPEDLRFNENGKILKEN